MAVEVTDIAGTTHRLVYTCCCALLFVFWLYSECSFL